jgi:hypothetical protein
MAGVFASAALAWHWLLAGDGWDWIAALTRLVGPAIAVVALLSGGSEAARLAAAEAALDALSTADEGQVRRFAAMSGGPLPAWFAPEAPEAGDGQS